jgi:hypothetical protein
MAPASHTRRALAETRQTRGAEKWPVTDVDLAQLIAALDAGLFMRQPAAILIVRCQDRQHSRSHSLVLGAVPRCQSRNDEDRRHPFRIYSRKKRSRIALPIGIRSVDIRAGCFRFAPEPSSPPPYCTVSGTEIDAAELPELAVTVTV